MTEQTHMIIGFVLSLIFYYMFLHKSQLKMYKKLKKIKFGKKYIPELRNMLSFTEFKQKNSKN